MDGRYVSGITPANSRCPRDGKMKEMNFHGMSMDVTTMPKEIRLRMVDNMGTGL